MPGGRRRARRRARRARAAAARAVASNTSTCDATTERLSGAVSADGSSLWRPRSSRTGLSAYTVEGSPHPPRRRGRRRQAEERRRPAEDAAETERRAGQRLQHLGGRALEHAQLSEHGRGQHGSPVYLEPPQRVSRSAGVARLRRRLRRHCCSLRPPPPRRAQTSRVRTGRT